MMWAAPHATAATLRPTVALVDVYEERLLVFAWGAHHAGQLGHDDFAKKKLIASGKPFSVPSEVACVHGVAGKLFLAEEGGAPIGVVDGDGVRIRQPLSCGVAQTCLASHDNVLWTWGANQHGQCGRTGHAESEVMAGLVAIGWTAVLPVAPTALYLTPVVMITASVKLLSGVGSRSVNGLFFTRYGIATRFFLNLVHADPHGTPMCDFQNRV